MFRTRRLLAQGRLLGPLLALALVAVQAAATAHELEHALNAHDKPSCVLHLYAEHGSATPTPHVAIATPTPCDTVYTFERIGIVVLIPAFDYQVRAPPALSRS